MPGSIGFLLRTRRRWAWLACAVAVGCGTTGLRRPAEVSGRVLEDTLGSAPDLAFTVRIGRAMSDSLYGPILRCALAQSAGAMAAADLAAQAETLDIWLKDDAPALGEASMVAVLRGGGVNGFSPSAYRLDDGRPEWAAGKTLRSGVVEHAPVASGHGEWAFVLPDHTLVLARGRAVDRARTHFANETAAPVPLEGEASAVGTAWASGTFLAHFGGELGGEIAGVTTSTFALAPGPDSSAIVRLQVEGERRAVAIEQRLRDWGVRDVCPMCRALARFVHVERAGAQLRVDVHAPGAELDDLRTMACSAGKRPEHLASPLPPTDPPLVPPRVAFVGGKDVPFVWAPTEVKPGEHALTFGMYDERGKLLKRLDGSATWHVPGENALAMELEHVVAGSRIVVHDTTYAKHDDEALFIFDAATGKRTASIVVPARGRLCASPTEPLVFVEDDEPGRQTMVHTDAGTFEKSARPAWCPARPKSGPCAQPAIVASCMNGEQAPKVPDLAPYHALALGDDAVILGERAVGGRHVPMAAGYDAAKGTVRWSRVLPTTSTDVADEGSPRIADIAYGTLLVEYDEWHGKWKLEAIDVKTGKTKWSTPLRAPTYFSLSPTRVWLTDVEHHPGERPELVTTVHALDLETGKPSP